MQSREFSRRRRNHHKGRQGYSLSQLKAEMQEIGLDVSRFEIDYEHPLQMYFVRNWMDETDQTVNSTRDWLMVAGLLQASGAKLVFEGGNPMGIPGAERFRGVSADYDIDQGLVCESVDLKTPEGDLLLAKTIACAELCLLTRYGVDFIDAGMMDISARAKWIAPHVQDDPVIGGEEAAEAWAGKYGYFPLDDSRSPKAVPYPHNGRDDASPAEWVELMERFAIPIPRTLALSLGRDAPVPGAQDTSLSP